MFTLSHCTEKQLFALSVVPPLIFTLLLLRALHARPDLLLEAVLPLIPGVKGVTNRRSGFICLQFEPSKIEAGIALLQKHSASGLKLLRAGSTDAALNALTSITKRHWSRRRASLMLDKLDMPESPTNAGERADAEEAAAAAFAELCASQDQGNVHNSQVWVNMKHLTRASFIPVLSLAFFAWDSAALHRRASYDFPLLHCFDADSSHCFYIEQDYNMWNYPAYHRLDCVGMREKTVGEGTYAFKAPEKARFYKCYVSVLHFNSLVSTVGDVLALTALAGLIIARASCLIIDLEDEEQPERLRTRLKSTQCVLAICLIFLVVSTISVKCLYGRWTNEFMVYCFLPGVFLFAIFLVTNRIDLLQERLRGLEEDSDSESGGLFSSESEQESCFECASRRLYGRMAKRRGSSMRPRTSRDAMRPMSSTGSMRRRRPSISEAPPSPVADAEVAPRSLELKLFAEDGNASARSTEVAAPPLSDASFVAAVPSPWSAQLPVLPPLSPSRLLTAEQMAYAAMHQFGAASPVSNSPMAASWSSRHAAQAAHIGR